jgi:hypothetical protein
MEATTGITGAIPVTGWALDDIEVTSVAVCRAPVIGEAPAASAICGGREQVFVGSGLFIDGARPDVQAAYPTHPLNSRAGWGFMLLTNMLPDQGNGTYQLFAFAHDREGRSALLGSRTIACDNANAIKPFGTIDTPGQGGIAAGANYVNFGWALTPQPKMIPLDGSTITVLVDGVAIGPVDYNHERGDIEALFPNFTNTAGPNGAIGFRLIDTTALTDGLHTISWTVSDDQGAGEGIGSRFFTVSNGGVALTSAPVAEHAAAKRRDSLRAEARVSVDDLPLATTSIRGRRGWTLDAPLVEFSSSAAGRVVVRSEEVSRIELHLEARQEGYLRTSGGLAPLPIGTSLDPATGVFTWAPGVGFVGTYDLVFVRADGNGGRSRREIRVVLAPKGSGRVGPQIVIDTPAPQQDVAQPFVVAGWAADLSAVHGTGIATLHAWAYPLAGGAPVFVGAAHYGGSRPDVAAVYGDELRESGFGLSINGLVPGHYDLAVFAWGTESAGFVPAKVVRITVR